MNFVVVALIKKESVVSGSKHCSITYMTNYLTQNKDGKCSEGICDGSGVVIEGEFDDHVERDCLCKTSQHESDA